MIDSGYGADALRVFELFIAPYDQDTVWNTNGVPGSYRFLNRVWDLVQDLLVSESTEAVENQSEHETKLLSEVEKTVKKVTQELERLSFNTAIAKLMELNKTMREIMKDLPLSAARDVWKQALEKNIILLAPFAPHMSEELWQQLGHETSIHKDSGQLGQGDG